MTSCCYSDVPPRWSPQHPLLLLRGTSTAQLSTILSGTMWGKLCQILVLYHPVSVGVAGKLCQDFQNLVEKSQLTFPMSGMPLRRFLKMLPYALVAFKAIEKSPATLVAQGRNGASVYVRRNRGSHTLENSNYFVSCFVFVVLSLHFFMLLCFGWLNPSNLQKRKATWYSPFLCLFLYIYI